MAASDAIKDPNPLLSLRSQSILEGTQESAIVGTQGSVMEGAEDSAVVGTQGSVVEEAEQTVVESVQQGVAAASLASSELEEAFFAWSEQHGATAGEQDKNNEEDLSPEALEMSFFSEIEGDLLNEEDFFFPAQSSDAVELLGVSSIVGVGGTSGIGESAGASGIGEIGGVEDVQVSVGVEDAVSLLVAKAEEGEHLGGSGGGEQVVREPLAVEVSEEKVEENVRQSASPKEIAEVEIFGELEGPKSPRALLSKEVLFGLDEEEGESESEALGAQEGEQQLAIFLSRDEEVVGEAVRSERLGVFGRPVTFHANYRRFLVQLVLGLLFTAPLTFWMAQRWTALRPIQWTLGLHTLLGVLACLIFYFFPYYRRRVTLDDVGIVYEDELRVLYVPWSEVDAVHLHAVEAFFKPYPLCYARVVTARGDEFCFANFGNFLFGMRRHVSFGDPPYPIVDMRDADLLLALIIQQIGPSERTPDLARLRFRVRAEVEQAVADQPPTVKPERSASTQVWLGIWAFMMKLFFGFLSFLPTGMKLLLKSIKPAYAGVSLGIYAVFFRWEFALLLCVILIFHELGHVWAMQREGMQIRGVFLIPFFGAATVTDDVWPSWYAQARVNLAGPLWGSILTFLCLLAYAVYPADFFLAVAIWGALINLLNLMPVHPLDGGRILHAVACSLRSAWGFVAVIAVLALTVVFALAHELILLYLLAMIGVAEFFKEFMARRRADKMALLRGHETITPYDTLLLKGITGINFGERSAPQFFEMEEIELRRLRMILHAPPMRSDQIAKIGVASFLVAASLFGFLIFIRFLHPHAMMALEIFR
ncbi:site-2 protease family protein [Myxococcota bacterium]|nr:site-2 protease family protein [Myxococcota bacterium]